MDGQEGSRGEPRAASVRLELKGGRLAIIQPEHPLQTLRAESQTAFYIVEWPGEVVFAKDEHGGPTMMVMDYRNSTASQWKRVGR